MAEEVRITIGADVKDVQAKLASVVNSVGQLDAQTKGSLQGWAGNTHAVSSATEKLERQLKGFAQEQRQQGRMAKFYANEIAEMVPAAEGAKKAIQGLIGVGIEGLAGGIGFGFALESVKLLALGLEQVGHTSKVAFENADKAVGKILDEWNKKADSMRRSLAVAMGGEGAGIRFDLAASLKAADAEIKKAKESLDSMMFPWQRSDALKKLDELREKRRQIIADASTTYSTEKEVTAEKERQADVQKEQLELEKERLRVVQELAKADQVLRDLFAKGWEKGELPTMSFDQKTWDEMQPAQDQKRWSDSIGKGKHGDGFATDLVDPTNMLGSEDDLVRIQSFDEAMKGAAKTGGELASIGGAIGEAFGTIGAAIGGVGGAIAGQIGNVVMLTLKFIGLAIAAAEASAAQTPVIGWIAAAGAGVAVMASIIGLIAGIGARAEGGPVSAYRPYLVGERGPEIIVPGASGTVIPNHALGGGGGGVTVHFNAPIDQTWWRNNERHIVQTLREATRAGRA